MDTTIKILGTNSDHDTCNRCGKTGLKKVVWVEINGGESEPLGCECAARLMRVSSRKVWSKAKAADAAAKIAAKNIVHLIGCVRSVVNFYVSHVSDSGVATVICRANGSRKEVELWAENNYGYGIQVDAPASMNYARIEW